MNLNLKYGESEISLDIPRSKLVAMVQPEKVDELENFPLQLKNNLASPTGTEPLADLIKGRQKIVIVVDDISRPVPTPVILTSLLDFLTEKNNTDQQITVLIATGIHRKLNHSEFKYILGENISRVSIENHDPDDENRLIPIGRTSRDNLVKINRTFMEADFKILITDLDYHQFCGFGGGAKSVFPGLADRQSIEKNHARYNLPGCEKGEWLNNPIRQEIEEAGRMAKVDFLINVVLNNENKIAGIYAGDLEKAFLKGLDHLSAIFKKSIPEPADLVIASPGGYPLDINLYQAQKALQTASGIVEENAVIVLFAECIEGYGSEKFRKTVLAASGIDDIIKKHKEKFVLGAHKAYQFARELLHANIYLYSSLPENQVKELYLQPLRLEDMNKLIQAANKIVVLPYAVTTHVVVAES